MQLMKLKAQSKKGKRNPESGFVLIAAIMGVMILLAVGFFALTISTSDLRIASRLIGERKAFSAAESGVQEFIATFNQGSGAKPWTQVDSKNDPSVEYTISKPVRDQNFPWVRAPGQEEGMGYAVFSANVTGKDNDYKSQAELVVGARVLGQEGFGYE